MPNTKNRKISAKKLMTQKQEISAPFVYASKSSYLVVTHPKMMVLVTMVGGRVVVGAVSFVM